MLDRSFEAICSASYQNGALPVSAYIQARGRALVARPLMISICQEHEIENFREMNGAIDEII